MAVGVYGVVVCTVIMDRGECGVNLDVDGCGVDVCYVGDGGGGAITCTNTTVSASTFTT